MKKLPSEWEKETGIIVMDPDGWDRKNFEESWNTPIDKSEWNRRSAVSTCKFPEHFFEQREATDEERQAWQEYVESYHQR